MESISTPPSSPPEAPQEEIIDIHLLFEDIDRFILNSIKPHVIGMVPTTDFNRTLHEVRYKLGVLQNGLLSRSHH